MRLTALLFAFLLLGNTELEPETVPDTLEPFIVGGQLRTDDFGWMRGAFDGASEEQKAGWTAINNWLIECVLKGKAKATANLKLLGIETASITGAPTAAPICSSVTVFKGMVPQDKNWSKFIVNEARGRQVFLIFQHGARIAARNMPYEPAWGNDEAWDLLGATLVEQVYRMGHSWEADDKAPVLDPEIKPYFKAHLTNAGTKEDRNNTQFLKELVSEKGWPTIASVGEQASNRAWLLAQHADNDPAFQLTALRLMEPLAAKGEVSKSDYAYLHDRIMLKISGKQRFGTQFMGCEGDEHMLRPLEDADQLDKLRAEYGLEPIAEYRKGIKDAFGPCREALAP